MDKDKELAAIAAKSNPKKKVIELRASLIQTLKSDPSLTSDDFSDLEPQEKIDITNQMKSIILSNPDIYGEERAEIASNLKDISDNKELTIGDKLESFGEEVKKQASLKGGQIFIIAAVVGILASAFTIAKPFIFKNK